LVHETKLWFTRFPLLLFPICSLNLRVTTAISNGPKSSGASQQKGFSNYKAAYILTKASGPRLHDGLTECHIASNTLYFVRTTRGTNLMQKLWFIIINNSTYFGNYMSFFRSAGCVLLHVMFNTRCCGCGPKELVCNLVHCA